MEKDTEQAYSKDLKMAMALSIFEGICFFVAGVCGLMTATLLGYISGGLLIILACMNIYPVFFRGGKFFLNMGISLANDEQAEDFYNREYEEDDEE